MPQRKTKILLADEVYELRWISGPVRRRGQELAYYVDSSRRVVELSDLLSGDQLVGVVAAMASDYSRRRWRPIEVETGTHWWADEARSR